MEQRILREWKSIVCPDGKVQCGVMSEWDILSEAGRIVKKTLKQIDCHNPRLAEFGGTDCSWVCEKAMAKEEIMRSRIEWLFVCAIFIGGILWIVLYNMYLRPFLHLYGLILFFGLPSVIGIMLYYTWKMMRRSSINTDPSNFQVGLSGRSSLNS